jgi:hypothetical protein
MCTNDFSTPDAFEEMVVRNSSRKPVKPQIIKMAGLRVFAWKEYFSRHLNPDLKNHSHYRSFKFVRNPQEEIEMFYKLNSTVEDWEGFNGSRIEGMLIKIIFCFRD